MEDQARWQAHVGAAREWSRTSFGRQPEAP